MNYSSHHYVDIFETDIKESVYQISEHHGYLKWIIGLRDERFQSEYSSQAYIDISETDIQAQSVRQISENHGYWNELSGY